MSKKTNGDDKDKKAAASKAPEPEDDGKATDPSLLQYEKQPFILDKLFRTGSMGRLTAGTVAEAKGAIGTYEDYHWQLDRMYRKVPETMSLGNIRLKPDSLLYEGEHFILGKMERDVREADGYNPTAGRAESLIDIQEAIKLCKKLPKEPEPCPFPDFTYCGDIQMKSEGCCANITPLPGQVYNFAHPMQLSVDGCGQPQCGPDPNQPGCSKGKSCEEKATNFCQTMSPPQCQAARQAMAIYDSITGYDHFPCNVGDRPELQTETTEDGVWSWLYSIIYAIFPVGNDFNCNRGLPAPPPSQPVCGTPSQTQVQPKKKCCKHRKSPAKAPSTTSTACGPDPNSFATPCQPNPSPEPSPSKIKRVSSSVQTQESCTAPSSKSNSKSTQN